METVQGRMIIGGTATGPVCRLDRPISFWGGVNPESGKIIDPRHPNAGADISGTILILERTIGSSSSSAIMLELIRQGRAPAALVLGKVDAILTLGVIIAREMGYPTLPVVELSRAELARLPISGTLTISKYGAIDTQPTS